MRLVGALGLLGLWQAAASVGAPTPVTALVTLAAVALGVWAVRVLRSG